MYLGRGRCNFVVGEGVAGKISPSFQLSVTRANPILLSKSQTCVQNISLLQAKWIVIYAIHSLNNWDTKIILLISIPFS